MRRSQENVKIEISDRKKKWLKFSQFCSSQWVNNVVSLVLILHTLVLIMSEYIKRSFEVDKVKLEDYSFKIFGIFYIVEGLIKSIAYLPLRSSRLQYLYNLQNFAQYCYVPIAISDFLYFQDSLKPQFWRVLRVLFTFRLLFQFTSIRRSSRFIIFTMIPLAQILLAFFFILIIFSTIGVSLFGDSVYSRCRDTPEPVNRAWPVSSTQYNFLCGYSECQEGLFCGSAQDYDLDNYNENLGSKELFYGEFTFANCLRALKSNLVIVGGDDWTELLYMVRKK